MGKKIKADELVHAMLISYRSMSEPFHYEQLALLCSPRFYYELMKAREVIIDCQAGKKLIFGVNIYVKSWVPENTAYGDTEKNIKEIIHMAEHGYDVNRMALEGYTLDLDVKRSQSIKDMIFKGIYPLKDYEKDFLNNI